MTELKDLACRLALTYSSSRKVEEHRYPGMSSRAQKMVKEKPELYARVAMLLMDGNPVRSIHQDTRVDPRLIRFIRAVHPELIQASRAHLVANLEEASISMAQRLVAEAEDLPIEKVPGALSSILDKLALLTGGITARVEHTSAPRPEDVQRLFEALPQSGSGHEGSERSPRVKEGGPSFHNDN